MPGSTPHKTTDEVHCGPWPEVGAKTYISDLLWRGWRFLPPLPSPPGKYKRHRQGWVGGWVGKKKDSCLSGLRVGLCSLCFVFRVLESNARIRKCRQSPGAKLDPACPGFSPLAVIKHFTPARTPPCPRSTSASDPTRSVSRFKSIRQLRKHMSGMNPTQKSSFRL